MLLGDFGDVVGSDISDDVLRFAKEKNKFTKLIKASATQTPFPEDSFDVVAGLDIFEHISNDKAAINEAFRVLRPEAFFWRLCQHTHGFIVRMIHFCTT